MLMLQSRQDVEKAVELVNEALEIDEKCDFAYETLATLEVQRCCIKYSLGACHMTELACE